MGKSGELFMKMREELECNSSYLHLDDLYEKDVKNVSVKKRSSLKKIDKSADKTVTSKEVKP